MKRLLAATALAAVVAASLTSGTAAAVPQLVAGNPHGIVFVRGARPGPGPAQDPHLVFHGGGIMTSSAATAIYWGPSWADTTFVSDKVAGLDSLYTGFDGSRYMGTNTEYSGTNGQVGTGVAYGGHVIDTSATSRRAPKTSDVLAVVARNIANPVPNGYYPVYSDQPRGHAGYCAWHSYGTINGVPVQFAFFFDLDGDPGCDPGDTSGLHSQGLSALANVSGHELSEAVTDPRGTGWYDASGSENADKCAWTFNGGVSLPNGTQWKIQGNWSNAAFDTNTGYANGGCIQGN